MERGWGEAARAHRQSMMVGSAPSLMVMQGPDVEDMSQLWIRSRPARTRTPLSLSSRCRGGEERMKRGGGEVV